MTLRIFFALALIVFLPLPVEAQTLPVSGYFSALPELPIPQGLREDSDHAVRFDQPEGRIVVLQARGTLTRDDIVEFYQETLPSLGWTARPIQNSSKSRYQREKEFLLMEIQPLDNNTTRLNIMVRPR